MRVLLLLLTFAGVASGEDNVMYFVSPTNHHIPIAEGPITLEPFKSIDWDLEIRTPSVETQNKFAQLVVGAWNVDTNYFVDDRATNVTFEATIERNGVATPISTRISSTGGGASLQYLYVSLDLELGGDPQKLASEAKNLLELWDAKKITEEEADAKFKKLRAEYAPNHPGVYTLRAFYRPKVDGKWKGELSTKTIKIIIKDQTP